jgi:hypothetical protein
MSLQSITTFIPESTAFRRIAFDAIENPALRAGYEYWRSKCNGRRFPTRNEIKPRDIAGLLRYVALIKVDRDDFIYRIVGDVIVMAFGVPLQNRRLSDLVYDEPGFGTFVIPTLRQVRDTGEPLALRGRIGRDVTRVNFTDSENLVMPLGPDGHTVDHILTVSAYSASPFGCA